MIGRGAIRNPWLFDQIRAELSGAGILPAGGEGKFAGWKPAPLCREYSDGRDVLTYIHELWENEITPGVRESAQVQRMKKFMNFIGEGIGEKFLFDIRRVATTADFFRVCEQFLDHDEPMPLEPPPSVTETPLDLPAKF